MLLFAMLLFFILACWGFRLGTASVAYEYKLINSYDSTNWFSSFTFQTAPDPTAGYVQYISLTEAESLGLAKTIGDRVYMSIDNTTVLPAGSTTGRKSIWIESNKDFLHGILIGDFAHIPGSDCGTWPSFWTIRNGQGTYGEIDIIEGFNDITQNYMTLHTAGACSFNPPADTQTGTSNNGNTNCSLHSATGVGCSVQGPASSYGTAFNNNGGGIYAMWWTSKFIKIYMFSRSSIPSDITSGRPNPSNWGLPAANFDSKYGGCSIDANFPPQTIYFDTTFCGGNAGGKSWTDYTDCSKKTGYSTCESYVAAHPEAYDDAYWLINSVKVYQRSDTEPPKSPSSISTDGTCGGAAGHTCQGSRFGNCCSRHGWCGRTKDYCGLGCQRGFGTCP